MNNRRILLFKDLMLIIRNKRPREILLQTLLILVLFLFSIYSYGSPKMIYGITFLFSFLSFYAPLIFNLDCEVYTKLFTTPMAIVNYVKSKIVFIQIVNIIYGLIALVIVSLFSLQDLFFYLGFITFNTLLTTYITLYLSSVKITNINVSRRKQSAFDGYQITNIVAFTLPFLVFIIAAASDIIFDPSNLTISIILIITSICHFILLRKFWEKKICDNLLKNKYDISL